jgi:hypothetical protein
MKQVSTKRVARILCYLTGLLNSVRGQKFSGKFLPGMLFSIGGLLKLEARNYLETKKKLDP